MDTNAQAKSMQRREFVRKLSGAMAAASAATLSSCASTRGRYASLPDAPRRDVPWILSRIDRINARIAQDTFFDVPSSYLRTRGLDERLFRDSIQAMLLVGTFGDLSEQDRAHPAMQQRMRESIGLFDRTILGMTTYIEGLSRVERRSASRLLKSDPEFTKAFQAAFDTESRKIHVPDSRLNHFHTLWNRSVSSLQRHTCSTIIDEYVDRVDRVALRCGISPETRRSLAVNWDEALVERLASDAEQYYGADFVAGAASIQTGGDTYSPGSESWNREEKRRRMKRVGLNLLKIDAFIWAGGILLCLIGLAASSGGGMAGLMIVTNGWILGTAGVIILIIAIIMVIAGSTATRGMDDDNYGSYFSRLEKAVNEVETRRAGYAGKLEDLVAEAAVKFNVDFNEIWKRIR